MQGVRELWPLFFIVIILGSLVGVNVMNSRPTPEEIHEIHDQMKAEQADFLPAFKAMAFDMEVLDNQTLVRKYPMPDVRYQLSVKHNSPFQKPDSLGEKTELYDFSDTQSPLFYAALEGKFIGKGERLTKEAGKDYYLVREEGGDIDTMQLEWRLFVQEELYED